MASIELRSEVLELLAHKALFWRKEGVLVISDLHIGKAAHFRKSGIAVPNMAETNNLWRLSEVLLEIKPKKVIFLGDLFHSFHNAAWEVFVDFLQGFLQIEFILIQGNHDVLEASKYAEAGLVVVQELELTPFFFTHDRVDSHLYNIHGHIHPGVGLHGKGRQRLTLPCFFFSENYGILPSFGDFTGLYKLKPKKGDQIYVVAENTVLQVS